MILKGKPTIEGAGVHLNRVFGYSESPTLDPFLICIDKLAHHVRPGTWRDHDLDTLDFTHLDAEITRTLALANQNVRHGVRLLKKIELAVRHSAGL